MSAEAAAARTTAETAESTRRAIGTTFDVVRAAAADPATLDAAADGATPVPIPADDPDLATAEIEQGLAAVRRGEDVYVRHFRSAASAEDRPSDEAQAVNRALRL